MGSPFIDSATLGSYLGRNLTSDAVAAASCCAAASDMCRDIAEQQFTQVLGDAIMLDGSGTDALLLPQAPVSSVGTVSVLTRTAGSVSTITLGTADYTTTPDGILFAAGGGGTALIGNVWPSGRRNIAVTYDHGFGTADFPASVKQVALSVASRLLIQGPNKSESIGGASVTYAANSTDFTAGELAILRKYKRTS